MGSSQKSGALELHDEIIFSLTSFLEITSILDETSKSFQLQADTEKQYIGPNGKDIKQLETRHNKISSLD